MTLTHTDLDTLRADTMRAMLTDEGRNEVWKYDITKRATALRIAIADQDYDNIRINAGSQTEYCLTGPGICDCPFASESELVLLIAWLCCDGYLSCYTRPTWRWQPHLQADTSAVAGLFAGAA